MTATTRMEPMGKQQRSVQLPPDIYEFAEAFEAQTGHKFNRLVLAALLRFLFEDFSNFPNVQWIILASAIERGSMKIEDIPLALAEAGVNIWEGAVHSKDKRELQGASLDEARYKLSDAQELLRTWEQRIKDAGDARKAALANVAGSITFKTFEQ